MLRRVTREIGALLILDEVITFRLGYNGAQGRFGVDPDLTALGKVIGGGFPVGAVGGRREVMAVFDPTGGPPAVPHGGTFSANPMTMMAGIAALEDLTPEAFAHLEALAARFDAGVSACFARHGIAGQNARIAILGMGRLPFDDIRGSRAALRPPIESMRDFSTNGNRPIAVGQQGLPHRQHGIRRQFW